MRRGIIGRFMPVNVCAWDDPASWNEFVATTPRPHFQQSWEWGELAPELGARAIRLAARCDGKFVGAMQVLLTPLGRTGQTYLYVPRGPAVFTPSMERLGPLLDAARLLGHDERAMGIKVEPNAPQGDECWKSSLATLGLRPSHPPNQPRSSWHLDISGGEETLLAEMKQKTRYNIRLAARKGVHVVEADERDCDTFFRLYQETARRDDFFIQSKNFYRRLFDVFRGAGTFCMLLARRGEDVLAAITLLRFGSACWYLHGASSSRHRNLMAPYLLQWEGIRWAARQGCTLYDFRAVPDLLREDQDMYGLYKFKEGFGGYQFTTLHARAAPYRAVPFQLWQLYSTGSFAARSWLRRRKGLPIRQSA